MKFKFLSALLLVTLCAKFHSDALAPYASILIDKTVAVESLTASY